MEARVAQAQHDSFQSALQEFEKCVESPLEPGELESWVESVRDSFEQLKPTLSRQLEKMHTEQFGDIEKEDDELFARVRNLRKEDEQLTEQFKTLDEQINKLARHARLDDSRQAKKETQLVVESVKELQEFAMHFIVHVRKQEVAIQTWMVEAVDRDRGTLD